MIDTYLKNGQLYTKRENIVNWEHNNQTASEEKLTTLSQDRSDLIEMTPLLVMPTSDNQNWLCLGGNKRNTVDGALGVLEEWIKPVHFTERDGRWFVCDAQVDGTGAIVGWIIRENKKSFSNLFAAQKYYSYKHNNQYGGIDTDILASDAANPQLEEIDFNEIYTAVGDPNSVAEFIQKIQGDSESVSDLLKASENPTETTTPPDGSTKEEDKQNELERFENRLCKCPACGEEFDPKKHRANSDQEE